MYEPAFQIKTPVMRKMILILFCFTACYVAKAQTTSPCAFESLFTFTPGMNKMTVMDSVNKTYKLDIFSRTVEKLPPYKGTGTDSIVKEIIVYKIAGSACFKGSDTRLQLEFADDKLYKAYLSTVYPKTNYNEMISNFNSLRNSIKPHWQFESGIKISGENLLGAGFDYSKTKKITNKTEKVSLQYVDSKANDLNSSFLLEVIWVNLGNTRMQNSNY
jgi:hypothetical protein